MDNNLFDDLVASIKEAGAIKRKEVKASRVTELELPDIKEVREKTGLLSNWTSSYINSNFRCSSKPYLKKLLKKMGA